MRWLSTLPPRRIVATEGLHVIVRAEGLVGSGPSSSALELRGRVLLLARVVWTVLSFEAILLFALSVPARYNQLSHPPADVRVQLAHAGLPATVYAGYLTALGVLGALVCCAVAVLIVRHRPHDRIGLLASLYLVLLGLASSPSMQAVVAVHPALALPANLTNFLLFIFLVVFFFLFPDGRFVPRWSRTPILVGVGASISLFFFTEPSVENPPGWEGLIFLGSTVLGIAAQIYRYVRVSDAVQRQQTKWVVLGAGAAMLTATVFAFLGSLIPTIGRPETGYDLTSDTAISLAFLFVPLTLGVAILRYRLWNIDIIINRALVYGTLTASLTALYLAIAGGLGTLIQAHGNLLLSLLAAGLVAVLFAPLRGYFQTTVNRLMYGERDDPYRVLTRVGERVGAAIAPEAALKAIAETVAHALKSPYVAITLRQADTFTPAVSHGTLDGPTLRFPLEYQRETVGELLVAPRGPREEYSPADRHLLGDLARQIGPAAHAVRLTVELQRSRERLVTAGEEERRRLRRDLHDGLGPQLAGIMLKLETARNRLGHDPAADALLRDLAARTETAVTDIRRLVYGLRPPALDDLGLIQALREAAGQYGEHGITFIVDAPKSLPPLPAAVEVAAYRIAQEAITNVVRHAGARRCTVWVVTNAAADMLSLEVQDDGRGVGRTLGMGVGLSSMRERAEELGGTWTMKALPGSGTCVSAELPLSREADEISSGKVTERVRRDTAAKQTDEAADG